MNKPYRFSDNFRTIKVDWEKHRDAILGLKIKDGDLLEIKRCADMDWKTMIEAYYAEHYEDMRILLYKNVAVGIAYQTDGVMVYFTEPIPREAKRLMITRGAEWVRTIGIDTIYVDAKYPGGLRLARLVMPARGEVDIKSSTGHKMTVITVAGGEKWE